MVSGKRLRSLAVGLAIFIAGRLLCPPAAAALLELKKKAGSYEVALRIDRNPPVVGDNTLELRITDETGAALKDADVLVNYYMPPMPRMAPMNYKSPAKFKKDAYAVRMRLIMAGPWIIVVKITAGGKMTSARFNIDAR
ncbi:MAG TPA: FixH family protein [Acidobacteriota bacterium]|nr:FixH family protein [Acidobacteriota bacterium]